MSSREIISCKECGQHFDTIGALREYEKSEQQDRELQNKGVKDKVLGAGEDAKDTVTGLMKTDVPTEAGQKDDPLTSYRDKEPLTSAKIKENEPTFFLCTELWDLEHDTLLYNLKEVF